MTDRLPLAKAGFPIPQIASGAGAGDIVSALNQVVNNVNAAALNSRFPETIGARLRKAADKAANGNNWLQRLPMTPSPQWSTIAGTTPTTNGITYANGGNLYTLHNPGALAASGGPTGTSLADIVDGAGKWSWTGPELVTVAEPGAPTVTVVDNATMTAAAPKLFNPVTALTDPTHDVIHYGGIKRAANIGTDSTLAVNLYGRPTVSGGAFLGGTINPPICATEVVYTDSPLVGFGSNAIQTYSVAIDDKLVFAGGLTTAVAGTKWVSIDLGGLVKIRKIQVWIYAAGGQRLYGLRTTNAAWTAPADTALTTAVMIGSSHEEGGNAFPQPLFRDWGTQFCALSGIDICNNIGSGGTSWFGNNTTSSTYLERVQFVLANWPMLPDVWILGGQANADGDNGNNAPTPGRAAATRANVISGLTAILAAKPDAIIVLAGSNGNSDTALDISFDAQYRSIVSEVGSPNVIFCPTISEQAQPMVSGTGNTSAPAGNGTRDYFWDSTDTVHSNQHGINFRAAAHVRRYRAKLDFIP